MLKIYSKIESGERISLEEATLLAKEGDFLKIGAYADKIARQKNGDKIAFLIDRNINYTNVCTARCDFCAFYRPHHHKQSYDLTFEDIDKKIEETISLGGRRILMQGGLHPEHTIEYYEKLVSHIRDTHKIHIHAFSPPEIHQVSLRAGIPYATAFERLKKAGLGSMPGGGAEILVDAVRDQIMEGKCSSSEWLAVMEAAHQTGLRTTATMMLGHVETWEDRIRHLDALRTLQDKTSGFLSFIPWTFQPEHTAMNPKALRNKSRVKLSGAHDYLRLLAVSRIYLDNFDHIQVSLLTQGLKISQVGLHFGADDLGSFLIEENVVRMAGCDQEVGLEREKMARLVTEAGLVPYERDTFYRPLS